MRLIGYVRVSTEGQADDGVSLDDQREKLKLYAELHGHDLWVVFEDPGHSAKTLKRPGLQAALAALKGDQAEGLIVAKLDRLTRSVRDLGELLTEVFHDQGAQLLSVMDHIDTSSATGRLMIHILTSISQWEREIIQERTQSALDFKKRQGHRTGSIPYGCAVDQDGVKLVANPQEQETIALIKALRAQGHSIRAIAAHLNDQAIPARGDRWHPTTIARILPKLDEDRNNA